MTISLKKQTGMKCPKCGSTQFENYVDSYSGFCLDYSVGRCYSPKCGYDLSPEAYIKEITEEKKEFTIVDFLFNPKPNNFNTINPVYLMDTIGLDSNFLVYLRSKFSADEVLKAVYDYMISATDDGRPIFWRIDKDGNVLLGKTMSYNPISGKKYQIGGTCFDENLSFIRYTPAMEWMNSYGIRDQEPDRSLELSTCLFGEHLITKYPNKPIMLVEDEKTAVILSLIEPSFNVIAVGELENLTDKNIYNIRKKTIIAFPSYGNFNIWQEKINEINKKLNSEIKVSNFFERIGEKMNLEPSINLTDLFLSFDNKDIYNDYKKAKKEIQDSDSLI